MGIGHVSCQRQGPSRGEERENAETKSLTAGQSVLYPAQGSSVFLIGQSGWVVSQLGHFRQLSESSDHVCFPCAV